MDLSPKMHEILLTCLVYCNVLDENSSLFWQLESEHQGKSLKCKNDDYLRGTGTALTARHTQSKLHYLSI